MNYYHTKILNPQTMEKVIEDVKKLLATEGFGILTEIDVQQTLNNKLDVHFRPYQILGACNPSFAYKALQTENKIGTMLPCNIIVQDWGEGQIEVSVVDPIASMTAVKNNQLVSIAGEIREKLICVLSSLH